MLLNVVTKLSVKDNIFNIWNEYSFSFKAGKKNIISKLHNCLNQNVILSL